MRILFKYAAMIVLMTTFCKLVSAQEGQTAEARESVPDSLAELTELEVLQLENIGLKTENANLKILLLQHELGILSLDLETIESRRQKIESEIFNSREINADDYRIDLESKRINKLSKEATK